MKRISAVILVTGLLVVPAATASAHTDVRKDGNDIRGPLDLRTAAVGDEGEGSVTHTLTTFRSWKPKLLRNGSYFALAFDTGDNAADFERCAFAFYLGGCADSFPTAKEGRKGRRSQDPPEGDRVRDRAR